jgi:hypothetical protein
LELYHMANYWEDLISYQVKSANGMSITSVIAVIVCCSANRGFSDKFEQWHLLRSNQNPSLVGTDYRLTDLLTLVQKHPDSKMVKNELK